MSDTSGGAIVCSGSMGSSPVAARSLGGRGVPVIGVAFDRNDPLLASKYCTESHVITSGEEDYERYRESLLGIARQDHARTLVPQSEREIFTVVNDEAFGDALSLPVVDPPTLETVRDRKRLLERAAALDVPTPEWRPLTDWNSWESPSVVKSRYSILETESGLFYPSVELVEPGRRPDVEAVVERMKHEPLVQRYVPNGTEFGFFAVYDHGDPMVTFQHRRVRSRNYVGGASAHRTAVDRPELERLGTRLLDDLDWHGPAMVEFRRNDHTGQYKLMEINPRFWGSLALPVAAGVDFPWIYYRLSNGERPDTPTSYDTTTSASYLRAEVEFLCSVLFDEHPSFVERPNVLSELWQQARTLPGSHFDGLSRDDPRPFVRDVIEAAKFVVLDGH